MNKIQYIKNEIFFCFDNDIILLFNNFNENVFNLIVNI